MFVRILGILQTLTKSAPSVHKHSLRQHMNLPVSTNESASTHPPQDAQALSPIVQQNLLHSVVTFLGSCSRRKHSPLLRDALRSVVGILALVLSNLQFDTIPDTLDLLALEKEMLTDVAVNLELDKVVSCNSYLLVNIGYIVYLCKVCKFV
jgi:hypothetical protein